MVSIVPPRASSNQPHVQTRNITFCYNKEGIITADTRDKGQIRI